MTKDLTPTEALIALKRAKSGANAAFWRLFQPEINPDTGYAGLRCLDCDSHLAASNPSRTAQEHFFLQCSTSPVCRVKAKDAAKMQRFLKRSAPEAEGLEDCDLTEEMCVRGSGGSSTSASQQSMDRYIGPPASVKKEVVKQVSRLIPSSNVTIRLVEKSGTRPSSCDQ